MKKKSVRSHLRYIVNVTTFDRRIGCLAPYAIKSLFNQNIPPDKIVLWLAHGMKIPDVIKEFIKFGLEIKFCEELKSYNKLIPALLEYPNEVLVTADDDAYYPPNWFGQLKAAFLMNESRICAHRAHEIATANKNKILPYQYWRTSIHSPVDTSHIFPTGVGGILYPPSSLHPICTNKDEFLLLAPTADDIWFWAMAKLMGTEHFVIPNGYSNVKLINPGGDGLWVDNILNGGNDIQLKNIFKRFPELCKITSLTIN